MGPPDFTLLGLPRIERGDEVLLPPSQARVFALAAYLAMESPQPAHRGTLAGLLWPDQEDDRARHNLRQALSTLRRILDVGQDPGMVHTGRDTVALEVAPRHVDARHLLDLLDACAAHAHHDVSACASCIARLEEACALYTGPFLAGFTLPESDLYDDWAASWRQRLEHGVGAALDTLATASLRRGDHEAAILAARRLLDLDLFQEAAHRNLMRAQVLAGNRGAALRQFDTLARLLQEELGVEPEPETVALHQAIRAGVNPLPGLAQSASVDASPANLPVPSTRLVGRERELAEIADILGRQDCRLLTLHGPGGSGKTHLALEIAQAHGRATTDVVAFVDLTGETSAEGARIAIANALGVAAHGLIDPNAALLPWIRERSVFLVLDNAEHLARDLVFLESLLAAAPGLVILVTSRERLGLAGEWIYDLPGLAWPHSVDEDGPEGFGAVALLSERIRQVRAGAPIGHDELPDLVRICQLVEGMPLALEMAASWATALSPAEIADGIRESLDFLDASSPVRANPRHQSMRAVIQSSWERLPPEIQQVFRRLSVFVDGFTRDAAAHIAGADAASLSTLVNASLLTHTRTGRYTMHGLLAQFAGDRLQNDPGEHQAVYGRHSRYYLDLLASRTQALNGLDQPAALRSIDEDLPNILTAWTWAIDHGDVPRLLDASPILWLYYVLRGQMHAGARAFDRLLHAFGQRAMPDVAGHEMLATMAQCHAGGFISGLGRYDEAIAMLTEGLERFRDLVCGRCIGVSLNMLAAAETLKGEVDAARAHLQQSLNEAERLHDAWSTAFAVNDLGMLMHLHFSAPDAASYCERGRALFRQAGDVRGEALAAHNLGIIAAHGGDHRRAVALHREALALREAIDDRWGIATSLVQLGRLLASDGDRKASEQHLRRALRIAWDSSILPVVLEALVERAAITIDADAARDILVAVARHPAAQDAVRARCEALLAGLGATPDPVVYPAGDDIWAIRTVDDLARAAATG